MSQSQGKPVFDLEGTNFKVITQGHLHNALGITLDGVHFTDQPVVITKFGSPWVAVVPLTMLPAPEQPDTDDQAGD